MGVCDVTHLILFVNDTSRTGLSCVSCHVNSSYMTLLAKCYCSVLARAIKLNLMVLAFAMNFFSTATESYNRQHRLSRSFQLPVSLPQLS